MPRNARIDAPGALHHIIVRGIERRKIFNDDVDRINFLDRLGKVLSETHTKCFAWALIPNHFRLLKSKQEVFCVTGWLGSWALQWRIWFQSSISHSRRSV